MLADENFFENFRNMCLEIYELEYEYCIASSFKKDKSKITDIHMLLMVEKGIRGKLCLAIHRHAKDNSKYMKEYGKNIKSPYFQYYDVNNLYGWAIS